MDASKHINLQADQIPLENTNSVPLPASNVVRSQVAPGLMGDANSTQGCAPSPATEGADALPPLPPGITLPSPLLSRERAGSGASAKTSSRQASDLSFATVGSSGTTDEPVYSLNSADYELGKVIGKVQCGLVVCVCRFIRLCIHI
jgi:hypothetical protein